MIYSEESTKKSKIPEINKKLDSYNYAKEKVSMILKSKAMPTLDYRYDGVLEELRSFKKLKKKHYCKLSEVKELYLISCNFNIQV